RDRRREGVDGAEDPAAHQADDDPLASRRRPATAAIAKLPMMKPTEVRASWRPYTNSVACRARSANGNRRTFQAPMVMAEPTPSHNSDRRISLLQRKRAP